MSIYLLSYFILHAPDISEGGSSAVTEVIEQQCLSHQTSQAVC